jgi:replicative DNA helicase
MATAERLPPQNIQAEACVIGSMILDARRVSEVAQIVRADDFFRPAHQVLFTTIVEMIQTGMPIDLVMLQDELIRREKLEHVGGMDYVQQCFPPDAGNAGYYAGIVREKSLLRQQILLGTELCHAAYNPSTDPATVHQEIMEKLLAVQKRLETNQPAGMIGTVAASRLEDLRRPEATSPFPTTRLDSLDNAILGLRPGHLVTLAGRKGGGKSSLALFLAIAAAKQGFPAIVYSAEMSKEEVTDRALAALGNVSGDHIRQRRLDQQDMDDLAWAKEDLKNLPLYLDCRAVSLGDIIAGVQAGRARFNRPVAQVVVDYLGIMLLPKGPSLRERISEMTRGLKILAQKENLCVLLVSQLRRPDGDENAKPSIYELKESGSIENDSNEIVLIYTPKPYVYVRNSLTNNEGVLANLSVTCRDGAEVGWPDGTNPGIVLMWRRDRTTYEEGPIA